MITYLHKKFLKIISKIRQNDSLLIAISGGQDSICLIKMVQDCHYIINKKVEYIYIDHQCKKDSKKQIKHLINYLKHKSINLCIYQIQKVPLSELDARNMRYQLIVEHAIKYEFSIIFTAHTKTDQIETFLQKLIRGTSLNGAISLKHLRKISRNLTVIRPIIQAGRMETDWFCRKFLLPVWSDSTNYNFGINRNRLRYELIPYLQQYYKINIEKQVNQFINYCHLDNEYIKQNTTKLYLLTRNKSSMALNLQLLRKQHIAIQIRVIQFFFIITSIKH